VEWLVAADSRRKHSLNIGDGGPAISVAAPAGRQHGYREGDTQTRCGEQLSELWHFDTFRFPGPFRDLNCPECLRAIAAQE
jgi:hypothetical protein